MARTKRNRREQEPGSVRWRAALYARLSREDGDKPESDSIANQRKLLEAFVAGQPDMVLAGRFEDDGCTGTNFQRPAFQRMLEAIGCGEVNCVVVKDLSRFGRDYIDVGRYLERWFPANGVRFIALGDNIDSEKGPYDMLLPVKNVINEQYARDISQKVRASIHVKQQQGDFIGAFASYGYRKDPENHNRLAVDPAAAETVRRIFAMFEQGIGKIKIAKTLNAEGIPCPSEYKRLCGEKYHNGQKLGTTTYWTYATIHRILNNAMYAGNMEQGRAPRQGMHGKAKRVDKGLWTVVEHTHEAIIPPEQWERVQSLLGRDTRCMDFDRNLSPFAGFLRCGDCGRAMSKTNRAGGVSYCCGSYKRYGPTACTRHSISHKTLESLVLADLNKLIASVEDLHAMAEEIGNEAGKNSQPVQTDRLKAGLERLYRLKKSAYEDYREGILSREDYLRYRADYEEQESKLNAQLRMVEQQAQSHEEPAWIADLLAKGKLETLDRATIAETVREIRIYEQRIEIDYIFSNDLGILEQSSESQDGENHKQREV